MAPVSAFRISWPSDTAVQPALAMAARSRSVHAPSWSHRERYEIAWLARSGKPKVYGLDSGLLNRVWVFAVSQRNHQIDQ